MTLWIFAAKLPHSSIPPLMADDVHLNVAPSLKVRVGSLAKSNLRTKLSAELWEVFTIKDQQNILITKEKKTRLWGASLAYTCCDDRLEAMFFFLFFCGEIISIIKHDLFFFSDSAANGWRHNKRYYLLYTHRFCRKCEELKNMKNHQVVSDVWEKKRAFWVGYLEKNFWNFCSKKHVRRRFLCLCKHHFQTWCIDDFDDFGHCGYKSTCSKWAMCLFWFELAARVRHP